MKRNLFVLGLAALAGAAFAQEPFFSEMLVNPPGTDDTFEGIEIQAQPGFNFGVNNGYYIVVIEGDGTPAGTIDVVIPLSGNSAGSNGLLLLRDNAQTLLPTPDPNTTIVVADFNPDIENGTQTYVLGYGDAPRIVGTDLDTNNDGVLDLTLSTGTFTVVDTFAYDDNDNTDDFEYGAALGGTDFGVQNDGTDSWTPEAAYRVLDQTGAALAWGFMRVATANPTGPFTVRIGSGAQYQQTGMGNFGIDFNTFTLNLGTGNFRFSPSGIIVKADSFNIVFGSLVSGGLSDVHETDDLRLVVQNGNTFLITQSPVTIDFAGVSPQMTASKVEFICEARASLVGLMQRLFMFNYVSNGLVMVDERAASVGTDQIVTVTKTSDASEFINSTTGDVKWQYRLKDDTPAFLASWTASIDQVIYKVTG